MVLENIYNFFNNIGFSVVGLTFSPITGGKGNIEYLIHLKKIDKSKQFNFEQIIFEAFDKLK